MTIEVKAGYKQTEVGVIPEEWEVAEMGKVGDIIIGLTYSPSDVREYGTLVLRSSNVQQNRLKYENNVFVEMDLPKRVIVKENDLLICVRNGSKQLIGKCALINKEAEGHAFGAFMSIYRSPFSKYIFYCFQSNIIQKQIDETMGATINQITNKNLDEFKIALPPKHSEQEAIAEALSDADAWIESLEELIEKKRKIKQGTMQELLTPPGQPGSHRLPGFDGDWEAKCFGEVFDYHPTATNSRSDLNDDGDILYIHYGDIHTRFHSHIDFNNERLPRIERCKCKNAAILRNGDWVMADASEDFDGVGKTIEIQGLEKDELAVSGLHTFLLREKSPTFVPGFKGHLGNAKSLHRQYLRVATGMKVYGVSKAALKDLLLPIPTPAEQTAIAAVLSDMDREIEALEIKLSKARKIKQGMMQELLTGSIRLINLKSVDVTNPASKQKNHNWQINEAVVISVLTKHWGSQRYPLGRKRYTKLSYLLHRHVEHVADGYLKKAAGPYNPSTRYKGPEAIAKKNGYIRRHKNGVFTGFVSADNISAAETYFEQWYGSDALKWLLSHFRMTKNDDLELLATVDMAMEEIRRDGAKSICFETIKAVIDSDPEWKPKLKRSVFSDLNIVRTMKQLDEMFE